MKKLLSAIAILATSLLFTNVYAASTPSSFTVTANPSFPFQISDKLQIALSGAPTVSEIAVGSQVTGPGGQSYNNIGDKVETAFGLSANTFADESSVVGSPFKGNLNGDKQDSFTSGIAFDYLSLHLGGLNIFFHFATEVAANTEIFITVSNLPGTNGGGGGISNYRAYNSGVSEVPVPAAIFLLAPALLGFLGLRRREKQR